ncbi:hypothetical protein HDK77DRAFT_385847 [Phyllosticta capitalensis]
MAPQCQALNLSDESPCAEAAHSYASGLFCRFHARQAYGLYKGYKRRNAELDALVANPHPYLRKKKETLAQVDFRDVNDENTLKELHTHLFYRHALLDRVIRARKLHHSRFHDLDLDYGHQHYLDHLSGQKASVIRALERLERRTAEVLYSQHKWFNWVRHLEDEEEKQRDAEKKKVKQEAALFKRHWKEVERRMRELRKKEEEKRQQEFLDQAWQERQKLDEEDDSDNSEWDPIEDVVEDERGSYIDLIKHFLWQETDKDDATKEKATKEKAAKDDAEDQRQPLAEVDTNTTSAAPKSKNAKKKARKKAKAAGTKAGEDKGEVQQRPGNVHIESAVEMRQRLKEGEKLQHGNGWTAVGTIAHPTVDGNIAPCSDREIDSLLGQVAEIKHLLFCRLLLSHAALLPVALRANTIDQFLADSEVNNSDLRDLCLKMEQPGLQEVRDACADLGRGEEDDDDDDDDEYHAPEPQGNLGLQPIVTSGIPRHFQTDREKNLIKSRKNLMKEDGNSTLVDFGDIDDAGQYKVRKIRVKVCGKWIYNYPSDKAMTRRGWLQFSIIAKQCSLHDAIHLCKSWDEFFELSTLAIHRYFPAGEWGNWGDNQFTQQLMLLGFFTYFKFDIAPQMTGHFQTGRHAQGIRRQHAAREARNFMCGSMKRNDPVARRFIQYLALMANRVVIMARDAQTGRVLVQPPRSQLWLVREKSGIGRASRSEWKNVKEVSPEFFDEINKFRSWNIGFKDYFDICIWDTEPGYHFAAFYEMVQATLVKAHRCKTANDFYLPLKPILSTIRRDPDTDRVRDLFPEEAEAGGLSMWDGFEDGTNRNVVFSVDMDGGAQTVHRDQLTGELPDICRYTEADRLEDEVLFPWEHRTSDFSKLVIEFEGDDDEGEGDGDEDEDEEYYGGRPALAGQGNWMEIFENQGPDMDRFINDTGPDEMEFDFDDGDSDDYDEETSPDPAIVKRLEDSAVALVEGVESLEVSHPNARRLIDPGYDPSLSSAFKAAALRPTPQNLLMSREWDTWMDKEKAFAFKDGWHRADLTPNAEALWEEAQDLFDEFDDWVRGDCIDIAIEHAIKAFQMLTWLEVTPDCNRRIIIDMRRAINMTTLFFDSSKRDKFFEDEFMREAYKDSMILNQTARALGLPQDVRSSISNAKRPKEQWAPVDACTRRLPRIEPPFKHFPADWDLTIRPSLAYLYRGGVICPRYEEDAAAYTVALTEPGRDSPDLFIDYRRLMEDDFRVSLADPDQIDPLLTTARTFASTHGKDSCFSVLKIWSASHFYPLMVGLETRAGLSFFDTACRCWEWKFVPKDMPYSERSMHKALSLRFAPYLARKPQLARNMVVRCDRVLVMGKDRKECERLTMAAVWMITTRPWRLEVDPWKSWFGVGLDLLEGLDEKWWTC